MATTFTSDYQIKIIGTGLEAGTWGDSTSENLKRLEQALGTAVSIDVLSPPTGSTPASADGVTRMEWLTPNTADADKDGSEGRAAFVEFTGAALADIKVGIRGPSASSIPNRIYVVLNSLSNGHSLILDGENVSSPARPLNVKNGAYALVLVYASGTSGGLTQYSVLNAFSKLQIDDLLFPAAGDIILAADTASALEITDGTTAFVEVDTQADPGPIVSLKTANVETGTGSAGSTIKSSGSQDLTLQTGNTLTGSISIVDGDSGAISITPETAGKIVVGETARTASITGATKANPVVITNSSTNSFVNGEVVKIVSVGGMVELNGNTYTVDNRSDTTFELSGVNGTGYTTYTSGGTATSADPLNITTSGTNNLVLDTNSGTDSGSITITEAADKNILIAPDGSGKVIVGNSGATGKLSTGGTRDLVLDTNDGGTGAQVTVGDGTNGEITLTPAGTGGVVIENSQSSPGVSIAEPAAAITDIQSTGGGLTTTITADDFPTATWAESGNLVYISGVTPSSFNGGPFARVGGSSTTLILTRDTSALDPYVSGGTVTLGSYLNFGDTAGTTGYGLRSMGGNVQAKNVGGDWGDVYTSGLVSGDGVYWESTPVAMVASGWGVYDVVGQDHNLGTVPRLTQLLLRSTGTQSGFAVGDTLDYANLGRYDGNSLFAHWFTATKWKWLRGYYPPFIPSTQAPADVVLANTNWEFFVRAWK